MEKSDYAAGTSSRSSKLVHGGLRYLQNFDLGLVREALLERQINAALAPHLVRPLPMIVPAFDGARPDRLIGHRAEHVRRDGGRPAAALAAGRRRVRDRNLDGSEDWSPARHRVIDGAEVAELLPALAAREPTSGYLFYDCQTDDVRLVLTVLGEAERFGAVFANGLEVTALLEEDGRARGAHVRDADSGEAFPIRAQAVVNATGVWADRIRPEELHDEAEVPIIRPSRGTHVIVPTRAAAGERRRDRPGGRRAHDLRPAVARPDADRARPTTTTTATSTTSQPAEADVEYLLERGRRLLRHRAGRRRPRGRLRRACAR